MPSEPMGPIETGAALGSLIALRDLINGPCSVYVGKIDGTEVLIVGKTLGPAAARPVCVMCNVELLNRINVETNSGGEALVEEALDIPHGVGWLGLMDDEIPLDEW